VGRHGQHVVGGVEAGLLVHVVPHAGPVGQQVRDGHGVDDLREVVPEERAGGRVQTEAALVHQADDRQRREALAAAGDAELGV
jgi:hypothetical protein